MSQWIVISFYDITGTIFSLISLSCSHGHLHFYIPIIAYSTYLIKISEKVTGKLYVVKSSKNSNKRNYLIG